MEASQAASLFALSSEREQVLYGFNDTAAAYPHEKLIHELVEEQAGLTPNAVAVVHGGRSITYAELNGKANQLARYLGNKGVGTDQLVGICVERSLEMVVGLLGILKTGGAYLPLDPNYPTERLQHMLEDAVPRVVLTQEKLRAALPAAQTELVTVDSQWRQIAGYANENLSKTELRQTAQDRVYVIYTSGSTGRPKGTAMAHHSMVNLIEWHRKCFRANDAKRVLQFAALSFDVAFQEIFSTLSTGGTLVLLDEWVRRDARALMELLNSQSIERLFVPPLMLQSLAECFKTTSSGPRSLKDVVTAGEQLRISPEIVDLFKHLDGCQLHNHYGPTETHVVTALTLAGNPDEWPIFPTIGRPISNTQIYILDGQQHPVPIGVTGEIHIAGANVARGYLNRPELTAERFRRAPFSSDPLSRMYKTGDLGRWRADGTIEYLGRNDDQVKIRGYRIELGEIEALLARHANVKEAAVIAREDAPGEKRLVAYVTQRDRGSITVDELRAHLQTVLPDYMVPRAFVILEALPLTPSGKLNRRAFPAPDLGAYASKQYEAPQGEVEEILAGIWQELLRVECVGRNDNFLELGGHSLLIVRMMERLRRAGLSAEVQHVFDCPTLADLARTVITGAVEQFEVPPNLIPPGCEALTPRMLPLVELQPEEIERIAKAVPGGAANVQDIYPLAPLQEGILFHHKLDERGGGDTYVLPMLLSLSSRERLDDFIAALQQVIDRHDILRTAVLWEQLPRPVQVVYRRAVLPVEELVLDPDRDAAELLKGWMRPERQRLDLRQAPLMRLQVAADAHSAQWYGLLQLHHLAGDHESVETMFAEVTAYLEKRAQALPVPVPFRNHVAQALALVQAQTHDAEAFFRNRLGDIDEPTAPFGLVDVYGDGSRVEDARQAVDPALAKRIRTQARRLSVSAATLFHAAWGLVVARTSGRDDVVYGTVLLGRLQANPGTQRILGMFINTLPLRLRIQGATARDLVEQTQRELVALLKHEQASLTVAQSCSGVGGTAPLFNALLNYRHITLPIETGQPLLASGVRVLASQEWTNYPVVLSVDDQAEEFVFTAHTDRRIDPLRVIGYISTAIQSLVDALERAPQTSALALSILPETERHQVIGLFNATQAAYPQEQLIHELFEQRVERTPGASAVVYEGQSLTFAELNRRANQLAWYLRGKGVGPDQMVGLCVERSLEMVVGLLGILKAGGAYVPLDPNYPSERLAATLLDAAPKVLLTQKRLRKGLPDSAAEIIALDGDWNEISTKDTRNLEMRTAGLRSYHLAYVIYTSGSTGQPKGVMIEHRNVASLWQGLEHIYGQSSSCQRIAVNASFNFDASVKQLIQMLSGRTIVLIPQEIRADAPLLLDFIDKNRIDGIDCTPAQLKSWISAGLLEHGRHQLRMVLVGGEPIDAELWSGLAQCSEVDFYNVYGPTESTVDTTFARLKCDTTTPHIGRPMENRHVYILDRSRLPVPIAVAGEIYIGGAGVARGYLNRSELTAEHFLPDPFSADPQARVYKTGDLGRWRSDGTIEYLGRNDHQVKIRGFRIELGDIDAQLLQYPQVKEAVVVAHQDELGEKRLVAYVVTDLPKLKALHQEGSDEAGGEMVAQWNRIHDETYSVGAHGASFVGWNSSYTGQPIPEVQMQEWLDCTVERIQALKPRRVLEIGCGVGLVLQQLAPHCATYVGTDFSAIALGQLQQWISGREDLKHVELLHRAATELQELQAGSFDMVVLNSVVQYFPDIDYLVAVLQEAVRLLVPGGKIFLGDVRHLGSLPMFHSAVQLSKAAATINVGQMKKRIARALVQEKELVIDPQFFQALPGHLPGISAAQVHLKRGRALNELTRYRYDVVLHTGEQVFERAVCEPLEWHTAAGSAAEVEAALRERRWRAVRLVSIPNPRLTREAAAQSLIETSDERLEASALRRQLNELPFDEVDPQLFWDLAQAHGYDVTVSPGEHGCFEVQLLDRTRVDEVSRAAPLPSGAVKPWSAYANDPLENGFRQQLIPQLREYLKGRLPEYMVPSAWMVLKQMPLTPNGKVDRRALPNPLGRPEEMGEYVAPRTELERTLADIWAQLLQVDQVGVQDNFFELGGHSLHGMKLIVKIAERLMVRLPVIAVFQHATIQEMAKVVESLRSVNEEPCEGMEFEEGVI